MGTGLKGLMWVRNRISSVCDRGCFDTQERGREELIV